MTEYVATRWYRAPEIVLGSNKYSKAVDIWSVGCVLGELIIGKAIFPGKSTIGQVELILDLLGKPKPEDIEAIESESAWNVLNSLNIKQKYSISQSFKGASKTAIDFLKKTLEFNPKKRITVEQALKHPFVEQFHCPEEEIVCDRVIKIPISDEKKLSIKEYQHALYNDILKKKKEQRKRWQQKYLQQLGISADEEKCEEDLLKMAQARRRDEEEKKRQHEKQREYEKEKEYQKQKEYEQQKYQHMKEQQHAQAHHKKYSKEDYQQQYQKQSSKQAYSKNEQMRDHRETMDQQYVKKASKNGEHMKSQSNNAGANNHDGYTGSYYGSRPMSQQSNVKSYYKNK